MQPRYIFAGPTFGSSELTSAALKNFEIMPPVKRGDVERLAHCALGLIVIVDGNFHNHLSVGHAEIRHAMQNGWQLWGVGSMGAIRAHEMRDCGMKGFGAVYEHFRAPGDFQDDEVAVLHSPFEPYSITTEPLVHLRYFVARIQADGMISDASARRIVSQLKADWFGLRTIDTTLHFVRAASDERTHRYALALSKDFDQFRVKTHDVRRFLVEEPWERDYVSIASPAPYMDIFDERG